MFEHQKVKLVWITPNAGDVISYCARVSNPANQERYDTAPKLLKYLVKNKHWSPFEMASMCLEIETTRDIGRQILRHRSFSFQEFSQRYAAVDPNMFLIRGRECRFQDPKNRQNSIDAEIYADNSDGVSLAIDRIERDWYDLQNHVLDKAVVAYEEALKKGIAKEQARALLPEGLTMSRMYMSGNIRSWIHYCQVRQERGVTQKEHVDIANKVMAILVEQIPSLEDLTKPTDLFDKPLI